MQKLLLLIDKSEVDFSELTGYLWNWFSFVKG